jgi:hypothetical protein
MEHAAVEQMGLPRRTREQGSSHWSDIEWLPCRDGKWRPTLARLQYVADEFPTGMAPVRSEEEGKVNGSSSETRTGEVLPSMRSASATEDVQWKAGGHGVLHAEEVLQPGLHGRGNGRCYQGPERKKLSQAIPEDCEEQLRNVREVGQYSLCSSYRRESNQQRSIEFADFVRILPQAGSFAKLCGDTRTEEAVLVLLKSCDEIWSVLDTQHSTQEVWRSFINQNKDRIRMVFSSGGWTLTPLSPLASSFPYSRVGALRAFGNAIVPALAAEFIAAAMECLP